MFEQESISVSKIAHEWKPVEDLPSNWRELCRDDLREVHKQWAEDRVLIQDETKVKQFQEEIAIRWAIETGVIERLYTVDRGVTVQILKAGMEALGQFHARGLISTDARALIADQRASLEMVMDLVGGARALTNSYIKELHHRLTLSQEQCEAEDLSGNLIKLPLQKGVWKQQPNNPKRPDGSIHQYCPPDFVQDEIDRLLHWHQAHDDVCPEVEAAWLHHRFTQIHPFQDGNGRVARAITSAVFLKADCLVLVIRDQEHRDRYLDTLEAADNGDLKPLVDLFADIQIDDLNDAIKSIRELRGETVVKVSESLAERAKRRKAVSQERVDHVMDHLIGVAETRLTETQAEVERAFRRQAVAVEVRVMLDVPDKQEWWSWQIIEAARRARYYAELDRPRRWAGLSLNLPEIENEVTRLVISLHAVGRAADLHAATAFLTKPVGIGEGFQSNRWQNEIVSDKSFRFGSQTAKLEVVEKQFRSWLEAAIESGLSAWGERM